MRWSRLGTALAVVAGTLALGAPGSPTPSVSAAPNDIIAVVIDGTGYGHGRGMSQWGAYGYAVDHGWDWQSDPRATTTAEPRSAMSQQRRPAFGCG